jgi:protease-4
LGELVSDVYRQFTEAVATERKLAPAVVQRLSDGRIYSGRQAMERGLVDRMGNFHDALSTAGRMSGLGSDPRIARPPKDDVTLLDVLLGGGISAVVNRLVRPLETANMPRVKYLIPW